MRKVLVVLLALVVVQAYAADIYNTMDMIKAPQKYNAGNGNAVSGTGIFGAVQDLRLADDFTLASAMKITEVEAAYVTFLGTAPANGVRVVIYPDAGNKPAEAPFVDFNATGGNVIKTNFADNVFGLIGTDLVATNLSINLTAGHWWIDILPYDKSSSGDWFYQVRNLNQFTGAEPYGKDGGEGAPGYGTTTWKSMSQLGFGAGDTAMRIAAIPEPATLLLVALGALALRRR